MSKVTEYKVVKAIQAGAELDAHTLVQWTGRPQHEVHRALVQLYPDQFGTPGVDVPYVHTATLDELVNHARYYFDQGGVEAILSFKFDGSPCGCAGPQNGAPLCPCRMDVALYQEKAAVAAWFTENAS